MEKSRNSMLTAQVLRWGPALLMMAVIFTASSFPSRDLPHFGLWDWLVKKGGHALGYALLAVAYLYALANGQRPTAQQILLAILFAGLYGVTDEFHQVFSAGRTPSATDVLIDTAGAAMGVAIAVGVRVWS